MKNQVAAKKRVSPEEIPSVQELIDVQFEIDALKGEHPEVFMRLNDLIDRYNESLEKAEKEVRAREVSCGPFDNFSVTVRYDAAKMYDELGHDNFFSAGGATTTAVEYKVDKNVLEAEIAAGKIPDEALERFRFIERKYRKPNKLQKP